MALSKGTTFPQKCWFFLEKDADISKIKEVLVRKGMFSEITYMCVLTYYFQVSSIILKSFRQGTGVILSAHRKTKP